MKQREVGQCGHNALVAVPTARQVLRLDGLRALGASLEKILGSSLQLRRLLTDVFV